MQAFQLHINSFYLSRTISRTKDTAVYSTESGTKSHQWAERMRKGLEKHRGTRKEALLTGREAASQSWSHIKFYFIFTFVRWVAIIHQRTYSNSSTGQRGTWQIFRNPVSCPKSGYFTKKFPENSPQAHCDFKENSLKCSRLGPLNKLPPKLWFFFSAYSSSPDSLRPSTWGTIFRLSLYTTKHSSIFFSVRGGTIILVIRPYPRERVLRPYRGHYYPHFGV